MQKGNHQFKLPMLSDPTDSELLLPFLSARHSTRLAFVGQWGWHGRSREGVGRPAASSVGTAQIKASLGMSTLPGDSVSPKSGCASCYWARDGQAVLLALDTRKERELGAPWSFFGSPQKAGYRKHTPICCGSFYRKRSQLFLKTPGLR